MNRRIAIVGWGNQGKKRAALLGKQVVATVDPISKDAQFRQLDEVPRDSYDVLFLCVPDGVKKGLIQEAIAAGKHVLVEKPLLFEKSDDYLEIEEAARKAGVLIYTAYNHRFEPHLVTVREELKKGWLGKIYQASFFYGNGTARDVRNSIWRDQGLGVLGDLGSHLLDLMADFGGEKKTEARWVSADCFENIAWDHAAFVIPGAPLWNFEMTMVSWKNTFRLDLYAENGSLHVDGLCKWGPSLLQVRRRVLPSGRPQEEVKTLTCSDPTWEAEHAWFLDQCGSRETCLQTDRWIFERLEQLRRSA